MTDERLEKILNSIDLNECEPIINNHIYYLMIIVVSI